MMRWPFPWRRHQEPDIDSRVAVEVTRRELHATYARAAKVHQVTEEAKQRAAEAKEQERRNNLAPTFQTAFAMRRKHS